MGRRPKGKYPHMLREDEEVWETWLALNKKPTGVYQYDVKVGQGITPDPRMSEVMQQWAIGVTKKRIDVVEETDFGIRIIEVKVAAGLTAIAQLVAYPILYEATFHPAVPVAPCLIASKLLLDVEMLLKVLGIEYFVVNGSSNAAS